MVINLSRLVQKMSNNSRIGELNEKSLHSRLKHYYALPEDELEVKLEGFFIDIKRDNKLIEIQTRNLGALKRKLSKLLDNYQVEIVHPIIKKKTIIKRLIDGTVVSSRKSPKNGRIEDVFNELIYLTEFINHKNLTFRIPIVEINEFWLNDGGGSWRRKGWSIHNKELIQVYKEHFLYSSKDLLKFLPKSLDSKFSNKDIKVSLKIPIKVAQKMTFTLRKLNLIEVSEKKGNAKIYRVV